MKKNQTRTHSSTGTFLTEGRIGSHHPLKPVSSKKSQAFHRHLSLENAGHHDNRAGYNGYFLTSNLSAL